MSFRDLPTLADQGRCAKPKGEIEPRAITKAKKAKAAEKHRRVTKTAIFARDGGKCRVCGARATEMHELKFRSLMGKRSLENSIAVCTFEAHNCHRLLQTHCIDVEGTDANRRLVFHWNRERVPVGSEPFRIASKRRSQRHDARRPRVAVPESVGAERASDGGGEGTDGAVGDGE